MRKLYLYITVYIVVTTVGSYIGFRHFEFTKMVFFTTTLSGVFALIMAKKAFKSTKGMEDY